MYREVYLETRVSHLSHCDVWSTSSFFKIGVNEFFQYHLDYDKKFTFIEFSRLNCPFFLSDRFVSFLSNLDAVVLYVDIELYPLALFYQSIMPRICIISENDSFYETKRKINESLLGSQDKVIYPEKQRPLSKKEFLLLKSILQGRTISHISRVTNERYKTLHSRYLAICNKMNTKEIKRISIS